MNGLIGTKLGMTQLFDEEGQVVPVTAVQAGPCTVVQLRSQERDGYEAVQVGFGSRRDKTASKAFRGHCKAAGATFLSLAEFRTAKASEFSVGQEIKIAEIFQAGDVVDVTGTTKGRGFAGVMKRHHFGGHRATHGTHESFRGPGSVGACAYPGRIFKGKKMAGHMGVRRRTTQNLVVVRVDEGASVLFVRGAVPGGKNGEVLVKKAVKVKAHDD